MSVTIAAAERLRGTITVPGDKSIAHRALMLGGLARGTQRIAGLPPSEDVASTAACLRVLGSEIRTETEGVITVTNPARRRGGELWAGNSGTTARLMAGLVAGLGLSVTIDGDASLRRRPMARIATPLAQMGAAIRTGADGCLPMRIEPAPLHGIAYTLPVASAQVKSAILLAGLHAAGETTVIEPAPTRDHTENMLTAMGVPVTRVDARITVTGGGQLTGITLIVPGDISSAAFFLVAASILPGSEVRLRNVGVNPTRTGVLTVLEQMGASIEREQVRQAGGEPIADLLVRSQPLRAVEIGGAIIPTLIDELPILAVAATQAEGTTLVRDAAELRHKESDRIAAIVRNLAAAGAAIEEAPDGFRVTGPTPLTGTACTAHGDHRIAMAMSIAGLLADGKMTIDDEKIVAISYPHFFEDLKRLTA